MPRLLSTLARIPRLIFYSYLGLIGIWAFFPSIRVSSDYTNEYISQTLISGQALRTVYPWDASFEVASVSYIQANTLYHGSPKQRARVRGMPSSDCTHLLVDWRLIDGNKYDPHVWYGAEREALILEVGHGGDDDARLNLTAAVFQLQTGRGVISFSGDDGDDGGEERDGKYETAYIGDTVTVRVDAGGRDHVLNLPWFQTPDAVGFHHQMHGQTYEMDIRLVARHIPIERIVIIEVWKSAPVTEWLRLRDGSELQLDPGLKPPGTPSGHDTHNLKSVKNIFRSEPHYSAGLLATFVVPDPPKPSTGYFRTLSFRYVRITFWNVELQSRTFWVRSQYLVVLAPVLLVMLFLLEELAGFVTDLLCTEVTIPLLGYCLVVLLSWILYNVRHRKSSSLSRADGKERTGEKMGLLEWLSKFWLTRYVYCCVASCCCCCCCSYKSKRRGYRTDEKRRKRVVIWGPSGPVYEDGL